MPRLARTVLWLGAVSLFTDAAGEMIYPLLPLFLTTVLHAGVLSVGVIEGAAESTAALLKIVSGRLSDRLTRRKPLVVLGYAVTTLLRPLVGLCTSVLQVLLIRVSDRVGKGVRASPRDALLADVTPSELRGRAYGLNRGMDNAGAVLGPLAAYLLLSHGFGLRRIFLLALLPGVLALLTLLFLVREAPRSVPASGSTPKDVSGVPLPRSLRRYLAALALFSLGNSSDALLLIWARDAGVPAGRIPLLWMLHNGVKALLNVPLGARSDRRGRRRAILVGWGLYGITYLGFAFLRSQAAAFLLFVGYGVYYAVLEGAERAWVADLAPPAARGRAFGWFHGIVGATALPASLLCSVLYQYRGPGWAFSTGAVLALLGALVLITVQEPERRP